MTPQTQPPDTGGRRVTDKILDAAQQAVRMERLEGQHNLLSQQVRQSLDAVKSSLDNVQLETRAAASKLHDLMQLQHSHDSNKQAIEDMRRSLGDLNTRLEEWFDDFDQRNNRRWEQHERNRDEWRLRHEAENENDRKDAEKDLRQVRETMIRAAGWIAGAGVLVSVVTGGFLWSLNDRFNTINKTLDATSHEASQARDRLDALRDKQHLMELYLVRGGANPNRPYDPETKPR